MTDNGSAHGANTSVWPLPSFYFKVSVTHVGDMSCSEVSGLEMESDTIEYRVGDGSAFTKLRMPKLKKSCDITMTSSVAR